MENGGSALSQQKWKHYYSLCKIILLLGELKRIDCLLPFATFEVKELRLA